MMDFHIGSILLQEPKNNYIKQCFHISEWELDVNDLDSSVYLVTKKFLDAHESTKMWLDIYKPAVSDAVYDDANRILFDIDFTKLKWHASKISASNLALICLFISSHYHNENFRGTFKDLMRLKGDGRTMFGLKRKSYSGVGSKRTYSLITNYAQDILNTMPDKFKNLDMMWDRLEGVA